MLINFIDATNDANHYTKPPPRVYTMPVDVILHYGFYTAVKLEGQICTVRMFAELFFLSHLTLFY